MKYAIIGAGGTGGTLGFYLTKAEKDVTLIARGSHLEAMQKQGLTMRQLWDGKEETIPVKACRMEEYTEQPDVILVCVKGYSLTDLIPDIRRIAGPETVVLPILNIYGTGGRLQKEFPGAKGYSAANLWRMRNFYLTYRDSEKLAPLVREISWSNNIIIMEKCKDDLQREFYIQMTKRYGWTKRVLTNFIEAQTYEKYLLNQTNFDLTLTEERRVQAKLAVKDEYTFDFAELSPEYSEHELEMQLVNNIRSFLIEMGGDFTFIGNQYHLMIGSRDLYIDLLLFHRRLRSLIAIELKIGEFEAEYAGKMQMYLTALDEQVKLPDENPSIGIIICKSKDKMYVEYALKQINAPIGVATYQLRNTLPEEMKAMLPEPEEIVKRLRIFEKE